MHSYPSTDGFIHISLSIHPTFIPKKNFGTQIYAIKKRNTHLQIRHCHRPTVGRLRAVAQITTKHHGIHYSLLKKNPGNSITNFLEIPRKFLESFRSIPSSDGNYTYHFFIPFLRKYFRIRFYFRQIPTDRFRF